MYCDFYQLRERPFNVTSDPKFLYLNACYREALASLHYGITQRRGFVTLIGEAGTGKTTLLKKLLDDLDQTTRTVFLFNTNVSFDEILEYIFHEFDLPVHNGKRLYMLQRLNGFLLEELRNGRNVALLIDEAQDLDYSVMEDLRLLSNLETAKEKILQIVLSGQPELGQKLANPGLRQLRQRVAINCRLQALSCDEVSEYIEARLVAAGSAEPKLFTRDAEARVFEISNGIPRLVNMLCDNALVIGYALGKKRIGADVVTEAAADLFSPEAPAASETEEAVGLVAPRRETWGSSQVAMVAIVVLAILVGLFSVGRSFFGADETSTVARATAPRRTLDVVPPALRGEDGPGTSGRLAVPVEQARGIGVPGPQPVDRRASAEVVRPLGSAWGGVDAPAEDARPLNAPSGGHAVVTSSAPVAGPPDGAQAGARSDEAVPTGNVPGDGAAVVGRESGAASASSNVAAQGPLASKGMEPGSAVSAAGGVAGSVAASRKATLAAPAVATLRMEGGVGGDLRSGATGVQQAATDRAAPQKGTGELAVALAHDHFAVAEPGDSLSAIAMRTYGLASPTILDLMQMANPEVRDIDRITVGQKLQLPAIEDGLALLQDKGGGYALLLLSTSEQRRANEIEAALRQKDFHAEVRRADFGGGRAVYRLMVPGFAAREDAVEAGKQLQRLFREDERLATAVR